METLFIAGFGGGVVRGLVGFVKHQYSYKDVGFKLPYFLSMVVISGTVGVLSALTVKELGLSLFGLGGVTPAVAFLVGYAGGDFLDNIVKIAFKNTSLTDILSRKKQ
jgi:hypothetical protein